MQSRCQTGVHVPRLLGHGQIHEGLHAFTAMSAGSSPLSPDMLKSCPAVAEHAMCALKAMHQRNMLHGDIALQNFVASDTINVASGLCRGLAGHCSRNSQGGTDPELLAGVLEHMIQHTSEDVSHK